MEAPPSGNNAIAAPFGANQKRLADTLLPDGGQDVGDIGALRLCRMLSLLIWSCSMGIVFSAGCAMG